MNFLEIAKKASMHSGLQGEIPSVVTVRGLQKDLVEMVKAAYTDLQLMREDWAWLYYSGVFAWQPTTTTFKDPNCHRFLKVTYDSKELRFREYDYWKDPATGVPYTFTIVPETNAIIVNPVTETFVLNYRAYRKPEELTTNTQIPILPAQFHYIIVYKAAADMAGGALGNADRFSINMARYDMMLGQLMRSKNLSKQIKQRPIV